MSPLQKLPYHTVKCARHFAKSTKFTKKTFRMRVKNTSFSPKDKLSDDFCEKTTIFLQDSKFFRIKKQNTLCSFVCLVMMKLFFCGVYFKTQYYPIRPKDQSAHNINPLRPERESSSDAAKDFHNRQNQQYTDGNQCVISHLL